MDSFLGQHFSFNVDTIVSFTFFTLVFTNKIDICVYPFFVNDKLFGILNFKGNVESILY